MPCLPDTETDPFLSQPGSDFYKVKSEPWSGDQSSIVLEIIQLIQNSPNCSLVCWTNSKISQTSHIALGELISQIEPRHNIKWPSVGEFAETISSCSGK